MARQPNPDLEIYNKHLARKLRAASHAKLTDNDKRGVVRPRTLAQVLYPHLPSADRAPPTSKQGRKER